MGRVAPPRATRMTNGQASNGPRAAKVQKQRKKHKVVLESSGDKGDDDKLRVVLSFHAEPPPGYTFIPAGNTQLTAAMKEFAKRGGHKIMAVSATPHAGRHELSREVHRIGYHFPTEVVAQVCSHYGIRLDSSGRLVGEQESEKLFMKISQKGEVVLNENVRDQVTINTEAKEIIRDLFPKIPDNDLFSIIKTAFQLGQNKVGTADEIPLVRRAQLSVVAHIRHTYTSYDRLLRQVNYNDARHAVEKETLIKLVEWRGDENDKSDESRRAVDDIVREVVVLSDEDESESELEEGQVIEDSGKKVKPAPKPKTPVLATEHRPLSPAELSPDESGPSGYRFVPQPPRRATVARVQPDNLARQQSRYAVWDQVRQEYHSNPPIQQPVHAITRVPVDEVTVARPSQLIRDHVYAHPQPVRYVIEDPQPVRIIRQASPTPVFRGADGRFYERLPPRIAEGQDVRRIYTPPVPQTSLPLQTQGRRSASPRNIRPQYHRRTPSMNDDGNVVPSIESPGPYQTRNPFESRGRQYVESDRRVHENRPALIDLTSSAEEATQRRPPSPSEIRAPFVERSYNNAQTIVEPTLQPRRQLIELDDNIPSPRPTYRPEEGRPHAMIPQDQYVRRPIAREYVDTTACVSDPGRVQMSYGYPTERRVVYESVPERQSVRYVAEDPMAVTYSDRNAQIYRMNGHEQVYRVPPQPYTTDEQHRRIIVLDAGEPMDGVQHTSNSRFPAQYTTHVHS